MSLIYRGGPLKQNVIDACLSSLERYPFVIEMFDIPDYENTKKTIKERDVAINGDMGWYTRKGNPHAIVWKYFGTGSRENFFFVETQEDYQAMLRDYPHLMKNVQPFETILERR